MSVIPTSAQQELIPNGAMERRFYRRVTPSAFINLAVVGTVGKLLDMSENGLSISAQSEVARDTVSRVSIGLNGLAKPIEVTARVVWTTESKKRAGIQLLDLSEHDRERIRKWQAQEANLSRNTEHPVSQASTGRVAEKSELLPVPAGLSTADVGAGDLIAEDSGRDRIAEAVKGPAEATASSYMPRFSIIGATPEKQIKADSGEHRRGQGFRAEKTSSQVALVICVALIAGLCFGIGTLFSNPLHKSQNRGDDVRTQNNVITPSPEGQASKQIDTNEMPANVTDPGNVSDHEQTSLPGPGLNNQIRGDFPTATGAVKSNKFRSIRQKDAPASKSSSDSVSDIKYRTVPEGKNSASGTASGTSSRVSSSNASSQQVTAAAGGATTAAGQPIPTSGLSRSTSESRGLTSGQANTNNAVSQSAGTAAPQSCANDKAAGTADVQGPSIGGSSQKSANINSLSNPERTNETAFGRRTEGNSTAPPFPSAYSSTSVLSTSAPTSTASTCTSAPTSTAPTTTASRVSSNGREANSVKPMGMPESRVIRLTVPKGSSSPLLNVPGERVLESPAALIRIQRSVFVPDEHKWWWPLHRSKDKEVLLGELISHVDPQTSRLRLRSGDTVRVRAIVDKDGYVVNLKPVSGAVELMPAVMRAVREWRYQPTYIDATQVETEAYISIEFRPSTGRASR